MPGVETAAAVLGVISSIISIVDGTKQVYDAARGAHGLPEAFREVATRLLIVQNVLGAAKQYIEEGDADEDSWNAVKDIMIACEEKTMKLQTIFQKVIAADDASPLQRYIAAVRSIGKGGRVETLMKGILEDIQLLAINHGMNVMTDAQRREVHKAIEDVTALQSSIPKHAIQDTSFPNINFDASFQTSYNYLQDPFSGTNEDEARACMAALFLTDPRDDREILIQMKGGRVDGTCEWIKTNELYNSWLRSNPQLLWLSGGPGQGKTMLSIFLAEELERTAKLSQNTLFLQYFCDNKDERRNTAVSIVRGLIYQLLQSLPKLFDHILPSFRIQKEALFTNSSFETLWKIFESMVCDPVISSIYCILDGLDECNEASLETLLRKFATLLSTKSSGSLTCHLNLVIFSRDFPHFIPEILSSFPRIQLDPNTSPEINYDIHQFIKMKVNELSAYRQYPEPLRIYVEEAFRERAQGTFLWVGIVAQALKKYKAREVENALELFPSGMEDLYARMLLQIGNNHRETAARILRWVVMAVRPLTVSELSIAIETTISPSIVALNHDEVTRDQVSNCGYFLTVKEDEIFLIHQSAKEYLLRETPDPNPELEFFRVKKEVGNLEIARKCLNYLQNGALIESKVDLWNNTAHLKAFPLLSYAALHWPEHARSLARSEDIFDLSLPFYNRKSLVRESWLKAYWAANGYGGLPDSFPLLHLASYFGILPLAENLLLKKGWMNGLKLYVNQRDSRGQTALHWAATGGHEAAIRLLLEKGSTINAKTASRDTALHMAAIGGHEAVVRLLLEKGADVDTKDTNGRTALDRAVANNHKAVVRLLLETRIAVDAKDTSGGTTWPNIKNYNDVDFANNNTLSDISKPQAYKHNNDSTNKNDDNYDNNQVYDGDAVFTNVQPNNHHLGMYNQPESSLGTNSNIYDVPESTSLETHRRPQSTLPTTVSKYTSIYERKEMDEDAMTVATDNQSIILPTNLKNQFIEAFATEIWNSAENILKNEKDSMERVTEVLPELLREFSLELLLTAQPGIQKDATIFIRHYRKYITRFLQESLPLARLGSANKSRYSEEEQLTIEEKMARWNVESDSPHVLVDQPKDAPEYPKEPSEKSNSEFDRLSDHGDNIDDNDQILGLPEARRFLTESEAFKRLLTRIHTASGLTTRKGQIIQTIRERILCTFTSRNDQLKGDAIIPRTYRACFQVEWTPRAFLAHQYQAGEQQIEEVITVNGSAIDAQAITCGEYIRQVWPLNGIETLRALQAALNPTMQSHKSILSNSTKLQISELTTSVLVEVEGTIINIADIGEQLAWLGAACRVSHHQNKIGYSVAYIANIHHSARVGPVFKLDFRPENLTPEELRQNGTCWHNLFKNPVIVKGFPILAREHHESGLEIPLNMMARLGEATRATQFHGQLQIKGFSTMFVPTQRICNSVLWHFLYNENETRMPYLPAKNGSLTCAGLDTVNYSCLESTRSFLGWVSSVRLQTGSSSIDYSTIRSTGPNFSGPGYALEKITISAGKFVTGGATFARGVKDSRLTMKRSGPYDLEIYWASRSNVVLYDLEDRRGWLVDGANALLHLTRAQLTREPYSRSTLFDLKGFPHADPADGSEAAVKALQKIARKPLVLFEDEAGYGESTTAERRFRVKDLVRATWHIVEQMHDHQKILSGPGMPLHLTDRDKLEGFGFVDIIDGVPELRPRVAILESSGRGWVDFIRGTSAITLMARGFGELMKPADDGNKLCNAWRHVPAGKDYLVAQVRNLQTICANIGDTSTEPIQLVRGLYLHQGGKLFEPCSMGKCSPACDRVQVLLPKYYLGNRKHLSPFEGDLKGAVIFGRSDRFSKWWPKNSGIEPNEDEQSCLVDNAKAMSLNLLKPDKTGQTSNFEDGGLGSGVETVSDAGRSRRSKTSQGTGVHSNQKIALEHGHMSGGLGIPVLQQLTDSEASSNSNLQLNSQTGHDIFSSVVQTSGTIFQGGSRNTENTPAERPTIQAGQSIKGTYRNSRKKLKALRTRFFP